MTHIVSTFDNNTLKLWAFLVLLEEAMFLNILRKPLSISIPRETVTRNKWNNLGHPLPVTQTESETEKIKRALIGSVF